MSGGNFLVSLKEVQDSEKILICRFLLKETVDLWKEDLLCKNDLNPEIIQGIQEKIEEFDADDFFLTKNSEEVAVFIAGYIARKINKKIGCALCSLLLEGDSSDSAYFNHLSRGQ